MANNDRLFIEISRKSNTELYYDYQTLVSVKKTESNVYLVNKDKICIQSEIKSPDELDQFDFVFINEESDVTSRLQEILNFFPDTKEQVAIACHKNGNSIPSVNAAISNETIRSKYKIYKPIEFSHTEHDLYNKNGLKPFFDCILNAFDNYAFYFDQLWNCIVNPAALAESLRYEILSPITALDMLNQSGVEGDKRLK
jgi:hypothetical protein